MARLEDFIANHRDEFDNQEPSDDHFKSFEQKLRFVNAAQERSQRRFPLAQIAAMLVLVVASALLVNQLFLKEARQYGKGVKVIRSSYNEVLDARYKQINIALDKLPESVRKDYEEQINEMKQQTADFEKTIDLTKDNPEVRQALLQHYKQTNKTLIRMNINAERNQARNNQNHR